MHTVGVNMEERQFHLDELVIPEGGFARKVPYLNSGRQIARNSHGNWFCTYTYDRQFRDRNWLALAVSDAPCKQGSGFSPPIYLVGRDDVRFHPVFDCGAGFLGNSCLLMAESDQLHVFYEQEDGLYLVVGDASGDTPGRHLTEREAWSMPRRLAETGSALGDATLLPSGKVAVYYTAGGRLHERILSEEPTAICEDAVHPSVWVGDDGTRHVACERDRRVLYVRRNPDGTWTDSRGNPEPEMVAHFCSSYPSIAVSPRGAVVIAYQGEGKVDLKGNSDFYSRLRPAGGSTVSYAVHSGERWQIRDFLRSSEILLKRRPSSSMPARPPEFKPFMEEFWRPSLAVDKHGVIWMFYLNTTRRHTYFARFTGERFGDHFEAQGAYDCLSRNLFVQKDSRAYGEIGTLTLASERFYFDAVDVPDYSSREGRRVVFLDNLELQECVGLESKLGTWEKHPEPLFGHGITGDSPDDDIAWCTVTRDGDGFAMEYMGQGDLRSNWMPGRAYSSDGVQWEKREPFDMSGMTLDGQPFPNSFWRPIYIEDRDETDPARKFKGLLGSYRFHEGIEIRCWDVVVSADTLAWHRVPGLPIIVLGDISVSFHLIRDDEDEDPSRRYKAAMLMGASSGRASVIFTSPDLIHWHGVYRLRENPEFHASPVVPWPTGPVAIDPDAAENPWEEEVHDTVIWRENGILMFHYDAFYFGANQHIQKALAISRDGKHYYRVKRGAINMPHGNCGEWDSGRDRTCVPIRVGDELWLYFCGMPAGHFSDPDLDDPTKVMARPTSPEEQTRHRELRPWRVGLAKLRVDGWAYLQLAREAGGGYVTTIPFDYDGGNLVVNGSGLGEGGIRAEVRTADNLSVIPGFERESCAFSDDDSVSSQVTWAGAPPLESGTYCVRFYFEGLRAKLYAFGFE